MSGPVFLLIGLVGILTLWPTPYDSTDAPGERSGLRLLTDNKTGCQYLQGGLSGITPRMDANGKQVCEARP